jgi:tRNA pseudouridine38-40 synthase
LRYSLHLAYSGQGFVGWQIQPNGLSIQSVLQDALSDLWKETISVVGCGRTDTGVHATNYFAHFDTSEPPPEALIDRLNHLLPGSISVYAMQSVAPDWHARFSAEDRTYHYYLIKQRDPLRLQQAYHYYRYRELELELLQEAADLLLHYQAFAPFCKSDSDVRHYLCQLSDARWIENPCGLTFTITANRFLRGMVRLIVGMCLQVGIGYVPLDEVKKALDQQGPLPKPWSVPAHGLYLTKVRY